MKKRITKKRLIAASILVVVIGLVFVNLSLNTPTMTVYDFKVKDTKEQDVLMSEYKGKVLLIVNTATECGLTPQYKDLQDLYSQYKEQGFEVLDFPCNQFAGQASGTNEELASFCTLKYKTTFQTFAKIEVNGDNASPLFTYLKENTSSLLGKGIKWNFTKFLVARDGKVVSRYAPTTNPSKIAKDIEEQLLVQ